MTERILHALAMAGAWLLALLPCWLTGHVAVWRIEYRPGLRPWAKPVCYRCGLELGPGESIDEGEDDDA